MNDPPPDRLDNVFKFKLPYILSFWKSKELIFLKLLPLISIVLILVSEVNPVYVIEFPAVCVMLEPLSILHETLDPTKLILGSKDAVDPLF